MSDMAQAIAEKCVGSMSPEALVHLIAKLEDQREGYRGEAAVRKVELQAANRGLSRLSAKVQRLKGRVSELDAAAASATHEKTVMRTMNAWSVTHTGTGLSETEVELLRALLELQRELFEPEKKEPWCGQGKPEEGEAVSA